MKYSREIARACYPDQLKMPAFRYCPHCGTALSAVQPSDLRPQRCEACGTIHFHNAKPCAGAIVTRDGHILLIRRGVEPFKGWWDIPGGFLQPGEHPEEGACREVLEETGLVIRPTELLGIFLDRYGEAGDWTLNIYYVAEVVGGEAKPADDAIELAWFPAASVPSTIAFSHSQAVIDAWRRRY